MAYRMTPAVDGFRQRQSARNNLFFSVLGVVGGTGIEPVTPAV